MEHKRLQAQAMIDALEVIEAVSQEFAELTGRSYGLVECYKTEGADRIIVLLGSTAGTAKYVVDELREQGEKVGLVKIRSYRPFPARAIVRALSGARAVAVLDKSEGFSANGGPVFSDVCAAFGGYAAPQMQNYIYGIGGRDVRPEHIAQVFADLKNDLKGKPSGASSAAGYRYLAVRE
jgi:pyruvate ferredoxin oxidoreductase alpha subunit